ncbi:MAG: endolytic transglycosylase MltG [Ignavibacteriaceae bacterium]|nr:endolytic transglycosylase MltG [Ignavibacteriaceae bacterium]
MTSGKVSFSELLSRKEWILVAIFFAVILTAFLLAYFLPHDSGRNESIKMVINRGESLNSIASRLKQEGLIRDITVFKIFTYMSGSPKSLQAGRYTFEPSNSYYKIISRLANGEGDKLVRISLYDGISTIGISRRLKSESILVDDSLIVLARDKEFLDSIQFERNDLIGYLLPGSHEFFVNSSSREILTKLYGNFRKFFSDSLLTVVRKTGYSVHQVLTLASIVEAETNHKEEMRRVAGVYLNRLRIGMKLQADPTIQFLLADGWRRLTYRDLAINSPYNTYIYYGIPPGPINNPGKDAILAVLNPEKHNYLFFVADSTGKHNFTTNYNDHVRLAKKYHLWLNSRD